MSKIASEKQRTSQKKQSTASARAKRMATNAEHQCVRHRQQEGHSKAHGSRNWWEVFQYIFYLHNMHKKAYPSVAQIARHVGCDERTVQRAVSHAEAAGMLEVTQGGRGRGGRGLANVYRPTKAALTCRGPYGRNGKKGDTNAAPYTRKGAYTPHQRAEAPRWESAPAVIAEPEPPPTEFGGPESVRRMLGGRFLT